jgi:hypothetical protein
MAYTRDEAYEWQGRQLNRELQLPREQRSKEQFQHRCLFAEDGSPLSIERYFDLVAEHIVSADAA